MIITSNIFIYLNWKNDPKEYSNGFILEKNDKIDFGIYLSEKKQYNYLTNNSKVYECKNIFEYWSHAASCL